MRNVKRLGNWAVAVVVVGHVATGDLVTELKGILLEVQPIVVSILKHGLPNKPSN